jgi:hypothetical protein
MPAARIRTSWATVDSRVSMCAGAGWSICYSARSRRP